MEVGGRRQLGDLGLARAVLNACRMHWIIGGDFR